MLYRYLIIGLLILLPAGAFATTTDENTSNEPSTILVVGDSLSAAHNIDIKAGWVSLLRERLNTGHEGVTGGKWQVINASISGETTAGGRARLPALLNKHKPELCIIELGANDGLRGQSIKRMRANLSTMITSCQEHGEVLLLGIWLPPNYGKQYTEAFKAAYPQLAEQHQVTLIPFFLDGVAGNNALMQSDGLHPNEKGQPIILDNVWPTLKTKL